MLKESIFTPDGTFNYQKAFDDLVSEVQIKFLEAASFPIETEKDAEKAIDMAGEARRLYKKIDAKRKEITEPARRFAGEVNAKAQKITDVLKEIDQILVKKVTFWKEEIQRWITDRTEDDSLLDEVLGIASASAPPNKIRGTCASTYEKKEWEYDVKDFEAVPREYLKVDEEKVQRAIKCGVREIPGLEVRETTKTILRTR